MSFLDAGAVAVGRVASGGFIWLAVGAVLAPRDDSLPR
jgi:hypothetical protein